MTRRESETQYVVVRLPVLRETEKAIRVDYNGFKFYLPRSQIKSLQSQVVAGKKQFRIEVAEWLWEKKLQEIDNGEHGAFVAKNRQAHAIRRSQAERARKKGENASKGGDLSESALAD